MPRYPIGADVITPRDGQGEIVRIYPRTKRRGHMVNCYGASVENNRGIAVYEEDELTPAAPPPADAPRVRCADCQCAHPSDHLPNTVICEKLARRKVPEKIRVCELFLPHPPAIKPATDFYTARDHHTEG